MERRDVQGHYEALAGEYDEHWVYGPDYIPWMSARIAETLTLSPADRIAGRRLAGPNNSSVAGSHR